MCATTGREKECHASIFFAVFFHVPAWSFERLPIPYRDSPFFTLDDDLFRAGPSNLEESNRSGKEEVDNMPSGTEQHIEFPEVPAVTEAVQLKNLLRKAAQPETSAAKCRELLRQIRNLMYIVEGLENFIILEEVIEKLKTCHHLLLGSAPKENGVILEAPVKPSQVDLKKKKPRKRVKKVHFKKLPVPSKKKPFSGRVGEKANVMKTHYNVTLRDIQSQTPAKKSKLDVPKVIKEKSSVAGCDFQQRESANVSQLMSQKIPQEKLSKMTRNRPIELIILMKHQQPFQVAFNSTLQFVNLDAGVLL